MVSLLGIVACSSRTPTERERAVAKLPSEARLIAAADGSALAAFRPVIDAARPFMPRTLDCVLDGALTSEAVALAVTPRVGTTIVVVTRAHVAACPALSRVDTDTFVATVGASTIAASLEASPLQSPRWERARSYLVGDPIALALDLDGTRVVAVAQPTPLDAWLAIDARDVAPVYRAVRSWLERRRATALRPLVESLALTTRGSQLLVDATKLDVEQLALLAPELLRYVDALDAPAAPATTFVCPPQDAGVVRCTDNTHVVVHSLAATVRELVAGDTEPVVAGADVIGIRLTEDAATLLRRGDIILAVDGHRITSSAQLQDLARYLHERITLAIRRDGSDIILELSE